MPRSRSGVLRQSLAPIRARLVNNINLIDQRYISLVLSDDHAQCQRQADDIRELMSKIKTQIASLTEKDKLWQEIILALDDDELLAEEEALYAKVALDAKEGYMTAVEYAREKLCSLERKLQEAERHLAQTSTANDNGAATTRNKSNVAKLPKLSLPSFSGDYLEWSNFWNIFKVNVHERDMEQSEKFAYLRGQLSGAALKSIDGIPVDNQGYPIAIKILQERFERSAAQLVGALYSKLKRLPTSSSRVGDLLSTYDSCEKIFRQLENAGEKTEANRSLILEVFSKYPASVVKDVMERQQVGPQSTLGDVRKALHQHIKQSENLAELLEDLDPFGNTGGKPKVKSPIESFKPDIDLVRRSGTPQTSAFAAGDRKPPPSQPQNPCYFCQRLHFNSMCDVYTTAPERVQRLRSLGRCGICMSSVHKEANCTATNRIRCFFCKINGKHTSPLCPTQFGKVTNETTAAGGSTSATSHSSKTVMGETSTNTAGSTLLNINEQALLLTATTTVVNPITGHQSAARLIFDSGSHRSYVTERFSERIGLKAIHAEALQVAIFGTKRSLSVESKQVCLEVLQRDGTKRAVNAHTTPVITNCPIVAHSLPAEDVKLLESMKYALADDFGSTDGHIDILIGSDYFWEFLTGARILTPSGLYMIPSTLGYLVGGRYEEIDSSRHNGSRPSLLCLTESPNITPTELGLVAVRGIPSPYPDIDEFWSLEKIGITDDPALREDDEALKLFNESVRFDNGRYHVSWPWKDNKDQLPSNYELAKGRLKSLAKRLQTSEPQILQKYCDVISDQLQKNIIEKVETEGLAHHPQSVTNKGKHVVHYLPHHPVVKPTSATTKVRIVYDASATSKKGSPSLNECLYRGPVLLPDLCHMLIRFRLSPVVVVADIEKAFLQMGLHQSDRDATRFLWLKDVSSSTIDGNVDTYRFCRVPFGVISSPFLLGATIQHHLNHIGSDIAKQISRNIYVDNVIVGVDDDKKAAGFYSEAKQIFNAAGMNLTEWCSNSPVTNEQIPVGDRCAKRDVKVLGLQWDSVEDTLHLGRTITSEADTKRTVLRNIASVYDPLGLFQPVMLQAKILLQRLWNQNKNWDDPLDEEAAGLWRGACNDILPIFGIRLPRCRKSIVTSDEVSLVTFCDASKEAYGAAVYVRSRTKGCSYWHSELAYSKSRLAPRTKSKSQLSLPRLELMGLTVGARATTFVKNSLAHIGNVTAYIFVDSMCVLHWLQSTKLLSVFVTNRVEEIKKAPVAEYLYVGTAENPADYITRGADAISLAKSSVWWHGPKWLQLSREEWPRCCELRDRSSTVTEQIDSESRKTPLVFHTILAGGGPPMEFPLSIDPNKYSTLRKLLRISVWCLKFIKLAVWDKLSDGTRNTNDSLVHIFNSVSPESHITTFELESAKRMWIIFTQTDGYGEVSQAIRNGENHPLVKQLGLAVDAEGIIRCCGRFQHADLSPNAIQPVLLPKTGRLTELIIRDVHERMFHTGVGHTLSQIRREFWIPQGRAAVRKILYRCYICRKFKGCAFALPEMPAWPRERVSRSKPFQFIGLDYLGPVNVRVGEETKKMWVCLFTCLAVRAIHLEWVSACSAKEFLNCVIRFIARRGTPEQIISDNAPQFRVSKTVLDRVWSKVLRDESVSSYATSNGIQWKFTTELAPWQGGFYERLVGVVKGTLRTAVGRRLMQWEEFITLIAEVEAIVNSRPITYVYSDFASGFTLRPADFLTDLPVSLPDTDQGLSVRGLGDAGQDLVRYWKYKQGRLKALWKFWYDEYLLSLRERGQTKHKGSKGEILGKPAVGRVVIVKDADAPRGTWKLAKVIDTISSRDGSVRSAQVQLANGSVIRRPINHLIPIEIESSSESSKAADAGEEFDGFTEEEADEASRRCQAAQYARNSIERNLATVAATVLF